MGHADRACDGVPQADRDGDLVAASARLMEHPDPGVRAGAATAWCAWEGAVISLEPNGRPNAYSDRPPAGLLAFVRIAAHYFAHGAWLEEGALLRDAGRLTGIPGVLIHGRLDLGSPLDTAWALARAWPDADLAVIDDSGHTGSDTGRERKRRALDDFARRSAATGLHDLAHSWHRGKIGSLRSWAGSPGQSIQTGFQRFRRRSHPRR